jgi:hypothetical protein
MSQKLRIASELHPAPGWIPVVLDSSISAAYNVDVVMWFTPKPGSQEFAQRVVEAFNHAMSSHQGNCK